MGFEVDESWLRAYKARTGLGVHGEASDAADVVPEKKRSKYGNERVTAHGMTFDSKHELAMYEMLLNERDVYENNVALMCQVAFTLPGKVKYVADFVMLHKDGRFTVFDAKSEATRKDKVYRLKRKLMLECLGIKITEL